MDGIIFNIKRYAIHDGPGIRVTFFMKGCPLSCWWCHNPEGISASIENVERTDRIGGKEFRVGEEVGRRYTTEDIFRVVERERIFIEESGGGVTFSGGEPMMQGEFLLDALKMLRNEGIDTCIDTSGHADPALFDSVIPFTSLFLFDIKHLDSDLHKKYTGKSNSLILSNLTGLLDSGCDLILRFPVIPGFNDGKAHLSRMKDFLENIQGKNLRGLDLLPYHKIGFSKYRRFGLEYRMKGIEQPSQSRMQALKEYFEETGLKVKIGG